MGLMEKLRGLLSGGTGQSLTYFENRNIKLLGDAFAGRPAERKRLVSAAKQQVEGKAEQALKALDGLREACRNAGDWRAVLLYTALCQEKLGNCEGAMDAYRAALRYAPEDGTVLSFLGLLLKKQGKFQAAEECYLAAEKSDPTDPYPKNNLAVLYYAMGKYEEALPLAEAALDLKGNMYQAAFTLAVCHMALGNREQSDRYARIAVANGQDAGKLNAVLKNAATVRRRESLLAQELLNRWRQRTGVKTSAVYATEEILRRSRIGGPSLGEAPLDGDGRPMRLLCAIYCDEFQNSILPKEGLLRIYIAENDAYGLDLDHPAAQTGFRVLYDREYEGLEPGEEPEDGGPFPVAGCYGIQNDGADVTAMTASDYRFDEEFRAFQEEQETQIPYEIWEEMNEKMNSWGIRIGGYPNFTQEDPRQDERYRKYDTLLFQLDSMRVGNMRIEIGDGGVMHFFIPKEKLERLDFSDVLYWWDCY